MLYIHNVLLVDITQCKVYEQIVKPDELYKQIGSLIKNRRGRLRITQEKLAQRLVISRASLANIETGRQNLSVHQLYLLASALDLNPSDLLPAVGSLAESELNTLPMPADLNAKQKQQIAQLLDGQQDTQNKLRREPYAKSTK